MKSSQETESQDAKIPLNGSKLSDILAALEIDVSNPSPFFTRPSKSELYRMINDNCASRRMLIYLLKAIKIPPEYIDAKIEIPDQILNLIHRDQLHSNLPGKWLLQHRVETVLDSTSLAQAELNIEENGNCTLCYLGDAKVNFAGTIQTESNGRFSINLDCMGRIHHLERRILRSEVPFKRNFSELVGIWLGLDCNRRMASSRFLMSKISRSPSPSECLELATRAQEKLDVAGSFWLDPQNSAEHRSASTETIHPTWVGKSIYDALAASKPGETHYFMTSCYPATEFARIEKELRLLGSNSSRIFKIDSPKIKLIFLLLSPDSLAISRERFNHYPNPQDTPEADIRAVIEAQLYTLHDVKQSTSAYLEVEIRTYDGWLFGHYFKFGDRITFFSPLLSSPSAVNSLMIASAHPNSRIWKDLLASWEITLTKSRLAEHKPRR